MCYIYFTILILFLFFLTTIFKYRENNENGPTMAARNVTQNFHHAERRKPDPKGCGWCASLKSQDGGHLWGRQRRESMGFGFW